VPAHGYPPARPDSSLRGVARAGWQARREPVDRYRPSTSRDQRRSADLRGCERRDTAVALCWWVSVSRPCFQYDVRDEVRRRLKDSFEPLVRGPGQLPGEVGLRRIARAGLLVHPAVYHHGRDNVVATPEDTPRVDRGG
jgi:hypothetical protein